MRKSKDTVVLEGLMPPMWTAINILDGLWMDVMNYELILTAGLDGKHSKYSRHYQGCAIDVRTWTTANSGEQMEQLQRSLLKSTVETALGVNYWVLDHGTHFHVAFKPTSAWTNNA